MTIKGAVSDFRETLVIDVKTRNSNKHPTIHTMLQLFIALFLLFISCKNRSEIGSNDIVPLWR